MGQRIQNFVNFIVTNLLTKFPNFKHFFNCYLLSIFYLFIFRFFVFFIFNKYVTNNFYFTFCFLIFQIICLILFYHSYNFFIKFYKIALRLVSEFYFISLIYWRFVFLYFTGFLHLSNLLNLPVSIIYLFFGTFLPWFVIIYYKFNSFLIMFFFFLKFLPNFVVKAVNYQELTFGVKLPGLENFENQAKFYKLPLNLRNISFQHSFGIFKALVFFYYGNNDRLLKNFQFWQLLPPLVSGKYYNCYWYRGLIWRPKISSIFRFTYFRKLDLHTLEIVELNWFEFFHFWTSDLIFFLITIVIFLLFN